MPPKPNNAQIPDVLVLGSGPAGVSAAWALVRAGRRVTLVDVGLEMDATAKSLRERLAAQEPSAWSPEDVDLHRGRRRREKSDQIQPFGSDFLFRDPRGATDDPTIELRASFARGGLSNGWGASVLPYRQQDIDDWPIRLEELKPHYAALDALTPISGRPDALRELFPAVEMDGREPLPPSAQGRALLARIAARKAALARLGVTGGMARQAVEEGCRRCGACLYGCPYGLIYNADQSLQRLIERGLDYRSGLIAEAFHETETGAELLVRPLAGAEPFTLKGRRLVIAAGVLSTARLVLGHRAHAGRRLSLRDSQHFYLPMLHGWSVEEDPAREPKHTLTQAFLEICDPQISARSVHVQVYAHNDLYAPDMRKRFGRMAKLAEPMVQQLSRRLMVAQGFLHSDHSARIDVELDRRGVLLTDPRPNTQTRTVMNAALRRIARSALTLGLAPLAPLARAGAVGSSFHAGATLPMTRSPGLLQTDRQGRLFGFRRVYVADASVFPSIPATTITLSVMANAHRIGAAVGAID